MGILEISIEEYRNSDVKEHRVIYFKRNGQIVWHRENRIDIVWRLSIVRQNGSRECAEQSIIVWFDWAPSGWALWLPQIRFCLVLPRFWTASYWHLSICLFVGFCLWTSSAPWYHSPPKSSSQHPCPSSLFSCLLLGWRCTPWTTFRTPTAAPWWSWSSCSPAYVPAQIPYSIPLDEGKSAETSATLTSGLRVESALFIQLLHAVAVAMLNELFILQTFLIKGFPYTLLPGGSLMHFGY